MLVHPEVAYSVNISGSAVTRPAKAVDLLTVVSAQLSDGLFAAPKWIPCREVQEIERMHGLIYYVKCRIINLQTGTDDDEDGTG